MDIPNTTATLTRHKHGIGLCIIGSPAESTLEVLYIMVHFWQSHQIIVLTMLVIFEVLGCGSELLDPKLHSS
jgi:hypothetical protein